MTFNSKAALSFLTLAVIIIDALCFCSVVQGASLVDDILPSDAPASTTASPVPSGRYAGTVSVAPVLVTFYNATMLGFRAGLPGTRLHCQEAYEFHADTNAISLSDWGKDDDCLTQQFQKYSLGNTLDFIYLPAQDALQVSISLGDYVLHKLQPNRQQK